MNKDTNRNKKQNNNTDTNRNKKDRHMDGKYTLTHLVLAAVIIATESSGQTVQK